MTPRSRGRLPDFDDAAYLTGWALDEVLEEFEFADVPNLPGTTRDEPCGGPGGDAVERGRLRRIG